MYSLSLARLRLTHCWAEVLLPRGNGLPCWAKIVRQSPTPSPCEAQKLIPKAHGPKEATPRRARRSDADSRSIHTKVSVRSYAPGTHFSVASRLLPLASPTSSLYSVLPTKPPRFPIPRSTSYLATSLRMVLVPGPVALSGNSCMYLLNREKKKLDNRFFGIKTQDSARKAACEN